MLTRFSAPPISRRKALQTAASGFGWLAFSGLAHEAAARDAVGRADPLAPKPTHFSPRAKRVIFLCMNGGPSHVDLFDHKPTLERYNGQEIPPSVKGSQRLTGMTSGQGKYPVVAPMWPGRRCGRHGTWISDPGARLTIETDAPDRLGCYRFGTGTAGFRFCRTCGVTLFAICGIDGRERAVVNAHTLVLPEGVDLDVSDSHFGGETLEQRLDRRAARWIGTVEWRS